MPQENIVIRGARQHNLKNVNVVIPRDKLVVITGVSGSGKSSLAFDTIYAEGQRRYVESLSAYARQFLGRMDKPDVEYIEGLSPAISIDQKGVSHNPRSTVGTVTEIYDYMRLLYARVGRPHCPNCDNPVSRQTIQQIVDSIMSMENSSQITILAPKVKRRKGEHKDIFEKARQAGFSRVRVNGNMIRLEETDNLVLDKQKWHYIDIAVDRLSIDRETDLTRLTDSVETAIREGQGQVTISNPKKKDIEFSERFACISCGTNLTEVEPRTFSFNSPHGACGECTGLGFKLEVDPELVLANRDLTLEEGAVLPWARSGSMSSWYTSRIGSVANTYNFPTDVPISELSNSNLDVILYGNHDQYMTIQHKTRRGRIYSWRTTFEGVIPNLERRFRETDSNHIRTQIEKYMRAKPCPSCKNKRLKPEALGVKVNNQDIMYICSYPIRKTLKWAQKLQLDSISNRSPKSLTKRESVIAKPILKEIINRLTFLQNIGLGYLTLNRSARTLSGGEAQRIRLATQIGSGLTGVLYVCDEPTIGLHPDDDKLLINTLKHLRDLGNTILVVEHDRAVMQAADHIVDMGLGAGEFGGNIVAEGPLAAILESKTSLTGQYLSGRKNIPIPTSRRTGNGKYIQIINAEENNLHGIDVSFPLGLLLCVTGVSGSGKSTLMYEVLYKKLAQSIYKAKDRPGKHDKLIGIENIDKVVNIDQSPIGRTPRSNPATYTGTFTFIRDLFASLPESKARGYKAGRFSFNVKGGRCEACQGEGYTQVEMQFLPNVTVPCESCYGSRYNREASEIHYKDQSISNVLDMTVYTALDFFRNIPRIKSKLETLRDVGLGYIRLGQPATTLSGGEAQRVKLATELSKRATGKTLYLLDEPTTGLSFEDCHHLLSVLHRLVDSGNSVMLIEHHVDMIKNADWIIDLGPGAAEKGGRVIATGTPEAISEAKQSVTGKYLYRPNSPRA